MRQMRMFWCVKSPGRYVLKSYARHRSTILVRKMHYSTALARNTRQRYHQRMKSTNSNGFAVLAEADTTYGRTFTAISVNSYPFQPYKSLITGVSIIYAAIGGIILWVLYEADTVASQSRLTGTAGSSRVLTRCCASASLWPCVSFRRDLRRADDRLCEEPSIRKCRRAMSAARFEQADGRRRDRRCSAADPCRTKTFCIRATAFRTRQLAMDPAAIAEVPRFRAHSGSRSCGQCLQERPSQGGLKSARPGT